MEYLIGAGAILETGENGSIAPANLHARVDSALAARVRAAAVDFEGTSAEALRKLLVLIPGFDPARFRLHVTARLRERRDCTLADVLGVLAAAAGSEEVHLFAHWLPDESTRRSLSAAGITVIVNPLEAINEASIVSGQRVHRWQAA